MGPRVLYELSQRLALMLEAGIESEAGGEASRRTPVFLGHPLDPVDEATAGTVGILYPCGVRPDRRYPRPAGVSSELEGRGEVLHFPGLWLRMHFAFLVAGGTLDEQLTAIGSAFRVLNDSPYVRLAGHADAQAAPDDELERGEPGFPLTLLDGDGVWQELGLPEHRLAVSFEVTVPLSSSASEPVSRTLERQVVVEDGPRGEGGA